MTTATIVRERPIQMIPEVAFHALGNCLWVLFEDVNYRQWCGIFGAGNLSSEVKLDDTGFAVLVSGKLYRVNANSRDLRFVSEEQELTDAVYSPERDLIVSCDWSNLYTYTKRGRSWRSGRVPMKVNRYLFTAF